MQRAKVSVRRADFDSPESKAKWLDSMATFDAWQSAYSTSKASPYYIARFFAQAPCYDPNDYEPLASDFQVYVRDSIKYIHDPVVEEFSSSEEVIERGFGDCDDKARLFVCLCRTVGIPARIVPVFNGPMFVHVRAEVFLRNKWRPVELIVRDLPIGKLPHRNDILV